MSIYWYFTDNPEEDIDEVMVHTKRFPSSVAQKLALFERSNKGLLKNCITLS